MSELLRAGVFSRNVVPELLFGQQRRDDVVVAGAPGGQGAYQVPQVRAGGGRSGGVRKAGGADRSSAPSGEIAAASRRVSAGRFHFSSMSFSTEVWSNTSDSTQSGRA